jgi:hypothetical protein
MTVQRQLNSVDKCGWPTPGFPSLVRGRSQIEEPRPGIEHTKPVVLWGREGSNPSPGAILPV